MRRITLYILVALVGMSCGRANYAKLVKVDSLLAVDSAHSAMMILKTFDSNDLTSENNAYYALLYTQAQYKLYEPIESDSLISIAVKYYTDNFDQDKLTRSLMYRGAALSDMGIHKEAIEWYKKADAVCDTSDYLVLGLINTRIAELYQNTYVENEEDIYRYKKALNYFRLLGNKSYELSIMASIGEIYRPYNIDSAYHYLNCTSQMAIEQNDSTTLYVCRQLLAETYYFKHNYAKAKQLSLDVIANQNDHQIVDNAYLCVIKCYANLHVIDSAYHYLSLINIPDCRFEQIRYNLVVTEIAKARGDYLTAYQCNDLARLIADSISSEARKSDLYLIEKRYDTNILQIAKQELEYKNLLYLSLFALCSIGCLLIGWMWYVAIRRKKRMLKEKVRFIDQLQIELELHQSTTEILLNSRLQVIDHLNQSLEKKTELEQIYRNIIDSRVVMMRELMSMSYQYGSKPELFTKHFSQYIAVNKKSEEARNSIIDIANILNNHVIDKLAAEFPNLTNGDKLLLSVSCLKFSVPEICVYLNLANNDTLYVLRSRLLKKLQTNATSIEAFLNERVDQILN